MKRIVLAAGAVSLLAIGAALAGDVDYSKQSSFMRKALSSGKGAVPTGIDVPGPADYVLTDKGVRHIRDPKDVGKPFVAQYFWEERGKRGGSGGESNSDSGSSQ